IRTDPTFAGLPPPGEHPAPRSTVVKTPEIQPTRRAKLDFMKTSRIRQSDPAARQRITEHQRSRNWSMKTRLAVIDRLALVDQYAPEARSLHSPRNTDVLLSCDSDGVSAKHLVSMSLLGVFLFRHTKKHTKR
ncbi:MAG: hypothetical protein ACKO8O_04900, partial [Betaproteobacteria bacterium]